MKLSILNKREIKDNLSPLINNMDEDNNNTKIQVKQKIPQATISHLSSQQKLF